MLMLKKVDLDTETERQWEGHKNHNDWNSGEEKRCRAWPFGISWKKDKLILCFSNIQERLWKSGFVLYNINLYRITSTFCLQTDAVKTSLEILIEAQPVERGGCPQNLHRHS